MKKQMTVKEINNKILRIEQIIDNLMKFNLLSREEQQEIEEVVNTNLLLPDIINEAINGLALKKKLLQETLEKANVDVSNLYLE